MQYKSTLLHLRIPFSFFLMPVYLFAAAVAQTFGIFNAVLAFIILHFFIYPASNGFNSYYDKDEDSIGGLENPPPVERSLLYTSLLLDLTGIILAFFVNWEFAVMVFIFGIVSKAYSHDSIRLKKYAVLSWLIASLFQGSFTFLSVIIAIKDIGFNEVFTAEYIIPSILSSLLLMGFYPMTQVYQHKEDARRGDNTISRMLGIRGTFYFTAIAFAVADAGFYFYFDHYFTMKYFLMFQLFLLIPMGYFFYWFSRIMKNENLANYRSTMMLNLLSALCMNIFFLVFGAIN